MAKETGFFHRDYGFEANMLKNPVSEQHRPEQHRPAQVVETAATQTKSASAD